MDTNQRPLGSRDPEHPHVPHDREPTDEPAGYRPEDEDPMTGSPGSTTESTSPFYRREILPAVLADVDGDTGYLGEEETPRPSRDYEMDADARGQQPRHRDQQAPSSTGRPGETRQAVDEEFLRNLR